MVDKDSYSTHFTYSRKMNTGDSQDAVIKCGTSLNGKWYGSSTSGNLETKPDKYVGNSYTKEGSAF